MPRTPRSVAAQGEARGPGRVAGRRAAGKGSQPPGPAEAARNGKTACASDRAFARGFQEVTHLGGNRPEPRGLAVLARRRWDASVPSTLLVWRSSARGRLMADSVPCSAVISESDGRAHRPASLLGMKEVWMGLVRFLRKLLSSEVPFLQVSAPSFR